MSGNPKDFKVTSTFDDALKNIQRLFEQQLSLMSLSKEQIQNQTLEELERSLERVDEAIENQDSFGIFKIQVSADGGAVLVKTTSDMHFEMRIAPLLLERKALIIDRIVKLRGKLQIERLRDLLVGVTDEDTRLRLADELNVLESTAKGLKDKLQEVEKQRNEEVVRLNNELQYLRRRNRIYNFSLRFIIGTMVVLLGAYLIFVLPYTIHWEWLLKHPNKLGLQASTMLILLGISWAVIDRNSNRRSFALGSIAIATLVGGIQLL